MTSDTTQPQQNLDLPNRHLRLKQLADGMVNLDSYNRCIKEMHAVIENALADFIDRRGHGVRIPRPFDEKGREQDFAVPIIPVAYAKALWDMMLGDLLVGSQGEPGAKTMFVRDIDQSGKNRIMETFHAIASIEAEYCPEKKEQVISFGRTIMDILTYQCDAQVQHGIKFGRNGDKNARAYMRMPDGHVSIIKPGCRLFEQPFEICFPDQPWDDELMRQAVQWSRWVTQDDHSAQNLIRFYACPLLERKKSLSFVWFGYGQNGKGILTNVLLDDSITKGVTRTCDAAKLLSNGNKNPTATEQEIHKMMGSLWGFDQDADTVDLSMMTTLKKISTGETVTGRLIGQNIVNYQVRFTFLIITNNPFICPAQQSLKRRMVLVRMAEGHTEDEFLSLVQFCEEHKAAPWMMASCDLWSRRDKPFDDVEIGDANTLTIWEHWAVESIVATGYAIIGEQPERLRVNDYHNALAHLGLRYTQKRIRVPSENGNTVSKNTRVLVVEDERKFAVFRQAATEQWYKAAQIAPAPSTVLCVDRGSLPSLSNLGFDCDYVPAGSNKKALNWQKLVLDDNADTSRIPAQGPYAVVPGCRCVIIDWDKSKTGDDDGWDLMVQEVGDYGSLAFPRTYLVKTPSGGYHGYYRIPDGVDLKNIAHPKRTALTGGIPIDLRTSRKGYALGATSECESGVYELVDLPPQGQPIPMLSDQQVEWLTRNGYTEHIPDQEKEIESVMQPENFSMPSRHNDKLLREMHLDMSPIPKGRRNDTLYRWGCGLLEGHPDEPQAVARVIRERGRRSGLNDQELSQIVSSVNKTVRGNIE